MKNRHNDQFFLPNFGSISSVFTLVIVGELLAILLVLSHPSEVDRLQQLSLISLFVQWSFLGSAATLTLLRPLLSRLENPVAGFVSYGIVILVTVAASEIAYLSLASEISDFENHIDFLIRNVGVAAIVGAIALRYMYIQDQLKRQLIAENKARLQALQSRIRPHFLFNSMNTIAALIKSKPDVAVETVEDLADLFRVSLTSSEKKHPLAQELEIARRYMRIEQLRLGERVKVEWDISEAPPGAAMIPMAIQPLLENAVYHGIEPLINGGIIQISARLKGGSVSIRIANTVPEKDERSKRKGHRIALENIRERLHLSYTPPGSLHISDNGNYFTVEIVIPYQRLEQ